MASRPRHSSRSDRDSDSMEALKPLVVLVLFGTILYGAYSVIQKGPSATEGTTTQAATEAPSFAPPAVEIAAAAPAPTVVPPAPAIPAATSGPIPLATTSPAPSSAPTPTPPAAAFAAAATPPAGFASPPTPGAVAGAVPPSASAPSASGLIAPPAMPTAPPPAMPTEPPTAPLQTAAIAAAAAGAGAAMGAAATEPARMPAAPTYLTAESAPPPAQDSLGSLPPPAGAAERPDRYATLSNTPPAPTSMLPGGVAPPPSSAATGSSAAFATAWADAHEKLAAGRYAEALAALSIWYDDPSLGLEESQRLEDLLGQLAGTVIYSQRDLLLPPHVAAVGETLPAIAMPLGISWQLLGKINGINDPERLIPGEHLKVIRGPFDAVVSVSRRRISLQLGGNYAGSFPVVVGRQFLARVGSSISVAEVHRGAGREIQAVGGAVSDPGGKPSIVLADGLVIEAAEDPGIASDNSPATSLVVSVRDLAELLDILGPGSKVLVRQ